MDYTELISTYGYAGLFGLLMLGVVGLPVPDEALLTFTGYLCFKGELQISAAIGTAWLGTSCGITMSYVLGRIIGVRAIGRVAGLLHASAEDLDRVHRWLQRRGLYASGCLLHARHPPSGCVTHRRLRIVAHAVCGVRVHRSVAVVQHLYWGRLRLRLRVESIFAADSQRSLRSELGSDRRHHGECPGHSRKTCERA